VTERPVTVAEAAAWLSVSQRTVRREIADGRLPAAKVRGIMRIDPADLAAYFARQKAENSCRSAATATDGKSEYESVVVAALSGLFPPARPAGTRKPSRARSASARSLLQLVSNRGD
jgi:excisionase family DNA binding protein